MKHVLVRERLIWEALHQDATSDFDVLWEILQSREVQGYVTDDDLTALYHRLAQEQGCGPAHQLTSQFRRVLKVYSPDRDGALDVAIAHPHDDNPLEPTEDLPTLSVASFLERYVLYQLYQTDTPEVPQGGWYRRWRASGFDPMLLWPVALVLVLQELPAFQQWLLAAEMMPGGDRPTNGLLSGGWAIASYPQSDATTSGPDVRSLKDAPPRATQGESNELPSSEVNLPSDSTTLSADPLLIARSGPLAEVPQFTWREIVMGNRGGDRLPDPPAPTVVELPSPPVKSNASIPVVEPAAAPVTVVARASSTPQVRPAAPVEPQRVEGFPAREGAQNPGGSLPVAGPGNGAPSSGQPHPPSPGVGLMGVGSGSASSPPTSGAPIESLPPGDQPTMATESPPSGPSSGSQAPQQETVPVSSQGSGQTDPLLGDSAAPAHNSAQPSNPGVTDALLNPAQSEAAPSRLPILPENFLNLNPHLPSQTPAPKNWQPVLDAELVHSGVGRSLLSSYQETDQPKTALILAFGNGNASQNILVTT
ncbi:MULTISPECIES: hypothetical protein [unclassified Leptolyngbya]|uniref:hypothetical protein n=1 Tax=unclassified Leptolyngbya TaxID=2650499 RepID=UPI0016873E8D|nr:MULTISPECIES: hypothetical protein [unclassified Leptolyngbya]MBD1910910.1 hypothetical protein [Leptolyngbya sp. FACHB-8]MBD2154955.1 hypothetical protein [Leptolyngbya sp. FACHB-16]